MMEPKVIHVSERVTVEATSSDGEWLDGWAIYWSETPEGSAVSVDNLPPIQSEEDAVRLAQVIDSVLPKVKGDEDG
jgi:hypothetical protein